MSESKVGSIVAIAVAIIACLGVIIAAIIAKIPIPTSPVPALTVIEQEVQAYANKDWQNTGIEVQRGEIVTIQYISGQWSPFSGYDTDGRGCIDPNLCTQDLSILENFPTNIVSGIHAALIARISDGQITVVGNEISFEAKDTGSLMLRMNDNSNSDNSGSILVLIKVKP